MRCRNLKNLFTITLFFLISLLLYSQNSTERIDRLLYKINNASAKERIVIYNDIAYEYYTISSDSTFYYAGKALAASFKLDDKEGEAMAYRNFGHGYRIAENLDSALYYLNLCLKLRELLGDSSKIASAYIDIGTAHTDYHEALYPYITAVKIYESIDDSTNIIYAYQNLAAMYASLYRHEKALYYFHRALNIVNLNNNKIFEGAIQNNMSIVYSNLKEYDKSENCLLNAIIAFKEINAFKNKNTVTVNLVNLYIATEKYEKAMALVLEAMQDAKKTTAIMNQLLSSVGQVYFYNQEYDSALMYLHDALQYNIKQKNHTSVVVDLVIIGSANMALKNNIEAIKYLKRSFKLANAINDYRLIGQTSLELSKYYKINKNYKKTLTYFEMHGQYSDSVATQEVKQYSMELEAKFASELKEKANLLLKNKLSIELIKRQKRALKLKFYLIVAITSLIIILLLLFVFVFYRLNTINLRKLNIARIGKLEQDKVITKQQLQSTQIQSDARNSLLKVTNNHLLQQAMLSSKLVDWLKSLKPLVKQENKKIIQSYLAEIKSYTLNNNWNDFEKNFAVIYPGVQDSIRKAVPSLSIGDLRILCFMIMRLDNSEISMITLQSNSSLRSATFRLRNKFNVDTNEELLEKIDLITGSKITNN